MVFASDLLELLLQFFSFLIALYIAYLIYSQIKLSMYEQFSLALILGGAIGNLIDRVLIYVPFANYSGVIDFIDVGIGLNRWYIFNIADSAVSVGIIIYLIYSIFLEDKNRSMCDKFSLLVDESNIRLDRFLSQKFSQLSRSKIQSAIKSGHIKLDGEPTKSSLVLKVEKKLLVNFLKEKLLN